MKNSKTFAFFQSRQNKTAAKVKKKLTVTEIFNDRKFRRMGQKFICF